MLRWEREGLAGRQTRFISSETLTSEVRIQSTPGQMLHGRGDAELRQKIAKVNGGRAAKAETSVWKQARAHTRIKKNAEITESCKVFIASLS